MDLLSKLMGAAAPIATILSSCTRPENKDNNRFFVSCIAFMSINVSYQGRRRQIFKSWGANLLIFINLSVI